jgi:uncharacterized membrane protein HdeD (DUF308 family)
MVTAGGEGVPGEGPVALGGVVNTDALRAHWWAFLIRGIIAVLFGLFCFFLTGAAILALVIWIGVFFVLDGVLMIIGALHTARMSHASQWRWQLVGGILGIVVGFLTFVWPGITALLLATLIAAWAFVTGVFELATAIRMRAALPNEWLWVINGILSILLGIAIFIFPGAGLVAVIWLLGFYAVLAGIAMIALSFRLRRAV